MVDSAAFAIVLLRLQGWSHRTAPIFRRGLSQCGGSRSSPLGFGWALVAQLHEAMHVPSHSCELNIEVAIAVLHRLLNRTPLE